MCRRPGSFVGDLQHHPDFQIIRIFQLGLIGFEDFMKAAWISQPFCGDRRKSFSFLNDMGLRGVGLPSRASTSTFVDLIFLDHGVGGTLNAGNGDWIQFQDIRFRVGHRGSGSPRARWFRWTPVRTGVIFVRIVASISYGSQAGASARFHGFDPLQIGAIGFLSDSVVELLCILQLRYLRSFARFVPKEERRTRSDEEYPKC